MKVVAIVLVLAGAASFLMMLPFPSEKTNWKVGLDWRRGDTYMVLYSIDGRVAIALACGAVLAGTALLLCL